MAYELAGRLAKMTGSNLAQVIGDYCRPTCGWRVDGECGEGQEWCGCPCGHVSSPPAVGPEPITLGYVCGACGEAIEGEYPHSDPETGEDLHSACCATCASPS